MTDRLLAPLLVEIARVAGEAAALKLVAAKAGTECYIPARAPDGHWLVDCVGREAADKLTAHFSASIENSHHGARIVVPMGSEGALAAARRLARDALDKGATLSQAARASGLTQRTISNLRARAKGDDRQGSLF